jgi:oxygen-independent coproporphyrinogen-3 oxidase
MKIGSAISDSNSNYTELTNRFGIYVHIPFCVHKCSYCDFYSFTRYSADDFESFTESLIREISASRNWLRDRRHDTAVSSVFFGGGTPSLLPLQHLSAIAKAIFDHFEIARECEFTMEANPETVTEELCAGLHQVKGLNRISLGAQSFDSEHLKKLERLGAGSSIENAAVTLRRNGFTNFNLDLIFGIPGQTAESMIDDIDRAVALSPRHVSFYNLTLKPAHTLFRRLPDDVHCASVYQLGSRRLAELGLERYEVSNFAKPGFESQHNRLYWDGGDFLGIGPSAASRFFWNQRFYHRKQGADYKRYVLESHSEPPIFEETTENQTILEATFLEMRKSSGVSLTQFHRKYGYDLTRAKKFDFFIGEEMIERVGDQLRLTEKGLLLADTVTEELAP